MDVERCIQDPFQELRTPFALTEAQIITSPWDQIAEQIYLDVGDAVSPELEDSDEEFFQEDTAEVDHLSQEMAEQAAIRRELQDLNYITQLPFAKGQSPFTDPYEIGV